MKLLALASVCLSCYAQVSLQLSGPPANIKAGSQVTLGVSISGTGTTGVAAIQFSIPGLLYAVAPTTNVPNKQIDCNTQTTGLFCIVVGFNTTALPDGSVASLVFTLPKSTPSGTLTLALGSTLGADGSGNAVTVGGGSPFALSITSPCDIDSNGTVNSADFVLALPFYTGQSACTPAFDLNSDGACNILDAQILAAAVGGGVCNAK